MSDVSVIMDIDAKALYNDLANVQNKILALAAKTTAAGEQAAKGFKKGFQIDTSPVTNALQAITAGAIGSKIKEVVTYGSTIQGLSDRFGVSTTALQQFGAAAEENGSSLEGLAKGLGKLEISRAKALRDPTGKEAEIFSAAGISNADLMVMSAEQIGVALAGAGTNAADFVAVAGKSALELIPTFRGVAEGTIQLGEAMDALTIGKLDKLSDQWKRLQATITIGTGGAITWLADQFEIMVAEASGAVLAIGSVFSGLGESIKIGFMAQIDIIKAGLAGVIAAGKFAATGQFGAAGEALKTGVDDARKIATKGATDAGNALVGGFTEAGEKIKAGKAVRTELEAAHAAVPPPPKRPTGEIDPEEEAKARKEQEADEEKIATHREKVEAKETERETADLGPQERLETLRERAADALAESADAMEGGTGGARDEEDRLDARERYLEITKEIADAEKEIADAAKKAQDEAVRQARQTADAKRTKEKFEEHERRRNLNPAELTLEEMAASPYVGGAAGESRQAAQEAMREEKLAKTLQLQGAPELAAEHQNRAEELKKSLGLENKIDQEKAFQDSLDNSVVLQKIRDNTAGMGANK